MQAFLETQRQPARCLADNKMKRPLPLRPTNPEAICPHESFLWLICRDTQVAMWSCHWPQGRQEIGLEFRIPLFVFLVGAPPLPRPCLGGHPGTSGCGSFLFQFPELVLTLVLRGLTE